MYCTVGNDLIETNLCQTHSSRNSSSSPPVMTPTAHPSPFPPHIKLSFTSPPPPSCLSHLPLPLLLVLLLLLLLQPAPASLESSRYRRRKGKFVGSRQRRWRHIRLKIPGDREDGEVKEEFGGEPSKPIFSSTFKSSSCYFPIT